eukprot:COSAG05_NODE_49_length_24373_cov_16.162561_30_plen_145_part_00
MRTMCWWLLISATTVVNGETVGPRYRRQQTLTSVVAHDISLSNVSSAATLSSSGSVATMSCEYTDDGYCDEGLNCPLGSDVVDCSTDLVAGTLTRGGCHCSTSWTVSAVTCANAGQHSGCSMLEPCDGDDGGVPGKHAHAPDFH